MCTFLLMPYIHTVYVFHNGKMPLLDTLTLSKCFGLRVNYYLKSTALTGLYFMLKTFLLFSKGTVHYHPTLLESHQNGIGPWYVEVYAKAKAFVSSFEQSWERLETLLGFTALRSSFREIYSDFVFCCQVSQEDKK